jgi:hypothetical protein
MQLYKDGSDPWLHPDTDWYGATLKAWSPQTKHNVQMSGGKNIKITTKEYDVWKLDKVEV